MLKYKSTDVQKMIDVFAEITENKSRQTGQHIRRVSEYAKIIALAMGMSQEQAEKLRLASTMHDIGKLMVPTSILEKPGKLTDEEFAESIERNVKLLSAHPNYIPFWAYTYGEHTDASDERLRAQYIVPVYIEGLKNYNEQNLIHRELL